jgi:hypothetical protein
MVRREPWPKVVDGEAQSLGTYEKGVAEIDLVCDHCHREIVQRDPIRYPTRLGETFCADC